MKFLKATKLICFMLSLIQMSMSFVVVPHSKSTPQKSESALGMTVLAYGNKKKDFREGSPLSTAVKQLGVPVKYSCKKGDCATCQISLAGRYTKPCVAKVPPAPKLKSLQEKGLEIRV